MWPEGIVGPLGPLEAAPDEIVEDRAPGRGGLGVLSLRRKRSPTIAQRRPCQLQLLADPDRFGVDGPAFELGEAIKVRHWQLDPLGPIGHLAGFGIAGAVRGDGGDRLAPLGGLGEAALLRRRKLRQCVQFGAVVETSASEIGERLGVDLLATGDITGDKYDWSYRPSLQRPWRIPLSKPWTFCPRFFGVGHRLSLSLFRGAT